MVRRHCGCTSCERRRFSAAATGWAQWGGRIVAEGPRRDRPPGSRVLPFEQPLLAADSRLARRWDLQDPRSPAPGLLACRPPPVLETRLRTALDTEQAPPHHRQSASLTVES